jgi:hypothetical protein
MDWLESGFFQPLFLMLNFYKAIIVASLFALHPAVQWLPSP